MFYFVIPTINGEIFGHPMIFRSIHNVKFDFECTIYLVNLSSGSVEELDL